MNAILHDPDDVAPIPQQATPHSSPRPGLSRWPVVLAAAFAAVLIALLATKTRPDGWANWAKCAGHGLRIAPQKLYDHFYLLVLGK